VPGRRHTPLSCWKPTERSENGHISCVETPKFLPAQARRSWCGPGARETTTSGGTARRRGCVPSQRWSVSFCSFWRSFSRPRRYTLRNAGRICCIFPGYTAVAINNPIQADGFSCGLFVCLKFWLEVDKNVSRNVDGHALTTHRIKTLHLVLRGRVLE
jgi:hypothetical protein